MKKIKSIQKEQKRLIEDCQPIWDIRAAAEVMSFERDVYRWYLQHRPNSKNVYLPLFWTAIWHVVHNYPEDAVAELIEYVSEVYDSLNKDITYYTITSEVHCNKQTFPKLPLNVQVYSPTISYEEEWADGRNFYLIPSPPLHPIVKETSPYHIRDIFCSYSMVGEYSCRKRLNDFLYGEEGRCHHNFVVSLRIPYPIYSDILGRSTFVLTPRGTHPYCHRLFEAIQHGAIPVYISDKFSLPYSDEVDWNKIAVLVNIDNIEKIPDILRNISHERVQEMQIYGQWFFEKYVKLGKMCERIFTHANTI